jgi:hypothetical protein
MDKKLVYVSYGFSWIEPDYRAAEQRYFPHASEYVDGASCYPDGGPKTAYTYVCPECMRAKQRWAARHPHHPNVSSR